MRKKVCMGFGLYQCTAEKMDLFEFDGLWLLNGIGLFPYLSNPKRFFHETYRTYVTSYADFNGNIKMRIQMFEIGPSEEVFCSVRV